MIYAIVALLILILDQGVKYWTTLNIELGAEARVLIPGVLGLENVHNYGAAFGILENMRWLLIVIPVLFTIGIIFLLATKRIHGSFGRWMAVLVMAGALGNAIDRAVLGYVVDMFKFMFVGFPTFNIADIFITCGGVLFCFYVIFHKEPKESEEAKAPAGRRTKGAAPARKASGAEGKAPANGKPPAKRAGQAASTRRSTTDIENIKKPVVTQDTIPKPLSSTMPVKQTSREEDFFEDNFAAPEQKASPSPQRRSAVDIEAPEFTLEDILSEFSDI